MHEDAEESTKMLKNRLICRKKYEGVKNPTGRTDKDDKDLRKMSKKVRKCQNTSEDVEEPR